MKKYFLLIFSISFIFSYGQNGLIGSGFGTNDWNTTDCFSGSAGTSRILTTTSNGTGNSYFRLSTCWDNSYNQWGPDNNNGVDVLLSSGMELTSIFQDNQNKAFYMSTDASFNYVFKTKEGGNPPSNLGLIIL